MTVIDRAKQAILEQAGVVEAGVSGHIPNFRGADRAAERLAALPIWRDAQVLKVVLDQAQFPVLVLALKRASGLHGGAQAGRS